MTRCQKLGDAPEEISIALIRPEIVRWKSITRSKMASHEMELNKREYDLSAVVVLHGENFDDLRFI